MEKSRLSLVTAVFSKVHLNVTKALISSKQEQLGWEWSVTLRLYMDAFSPIPPDWIQSAIHAQEFCCPRCTAHPKEAVQVWLNRRSPVYTEDHRRKYQEFYQCSCEAVWWGWSSDRPPNEYLKRDRFEELE